MKYFIVSILIIISLFSCDPGEIPIDNNNIGSMITNTIEMKEDYRFQIYYDLSTNEVVNQNLITDWDIYINFENNNIITNSSKFMQSWKISDQTFDFVPDLDNAEWSLDRVNSNNTDNSINEITFDGFYIIDLGYDYNNNKLDYIKFKVIEFDISSYTIKYASINNEFDTTVVIDRNVSNIKVFYSFTEHNIKNLSPDDISWDLLFTKYTHMFEDGTPYLVSGVLINYNTIEVSIDSVNNFNDIQYIDIIDYDFSNMQDIIGYNWKTYLFSSSSYIINQNKNYIIRDQEDRVFKLRFTDFYNNNGQKGYPSFELQEL
tara:strand:- start:5240 stop:6190 length:951 start_codon:yes stop_codon:yes gene_type:complete